MKHQSEHVAIYDTTLRDGSQAEGISFSKADKVKIARKLDELGVSYIEGGWPGSNPKDIEFFAEMRRSPLRFARLSAFGSTRRAKVTVEEDDNLRKLLEAETPAVAIFGKGWLLHVHDVLKVTPDENLAMIGESCAYLANAGREVFFDAEHFFDGWKDNREYSLAVLKRAVEAGAAGVVLCDTNGGTLPLEIRDICEDVKAYLPENVIIGIHCHNDSELAVANSIMAVRAGCRQIQGTINGYGERCGNANICSIIPNLELKTEFHCLPSGNLRFLKDASSFVDLVANVRHNKRLPFVGDSAFAHKGGMHVNAVQKDPKTFEHIDPVLVGNERRILVSDLSGRSNIVMKAAELGIDIANAPNLTDILNEIKKREAAGYEFEGADASFAVLLHKHLKTWDHYFKLESFRVIIEKRGHGDKTISEATVKLSVNGISELTAAEGEGPVNALDLALRKSLERFYPQIRKVYLSDFKVRILESNDGTASKTCVLIESTDGRELWNTVGLSENIIQASWEALVDSVEYSLFRMNVRSVLSH